MQLTIGLRRTRPSALSPKALDRCCDQHSEKHGNLRSPHIDRSKRCGDPIEQPPLPKAVGQFSRCYSSAICWTSSPMGGGGGGTEGPKASQYITGGLLLLVLRR